MPVAEGLANAPATAPISAHPTLRSSPWRSWLAHLPFTNYHLPFTRMTNVEIARRFSRLAALMELRGDDPFRLRSYRNAAETIEVWPTPLREVAEKEGVAGLQSIPGI